MCLLVLVVGLNKLISCQVKVFLVFPDMYNFKIMYNETYCHDVKLMLLIEV